MAGLNSDLEEEVQELLGEDIQTLKRVSGGCISEAYRLKTASGKLFFIKVNFKVSLFSAEALGLKEMARSQLVFVPRVIGYSSNFILLEWIEPGLTKVNSLRNLGSALARMHRFFSEEGYCGWGIDNFIGATPQINSNPLKLSWREFFCHRRLKYQWELMKSNGRSSQKMDSLMPSVLDVAFKRLDVDEETNSLLHGDLWSGNYLVDREGRAYLIDPAVYYGHREADLAMTRLFGSFPNNFYQGYEDVWPLLKSHEERLLIYQLYHVLNHVNLFGGGYLREAEEKASAIMGS